MLACRLPEVVMSGPTPKFRCYNGHMSGYSKRAGEILMEFSVGADPAKPETRTYECEVCGSENEITKTCLEWAAIHQ